MGSLADQLNRQYRQPEQPKTTPTHDQLAVYGYPKHAPRSYPGAGRSSGNIAAAVDRARWARVEAARQYAIRQQRARASQNAVRALGRFAGVVQGILGRPPGSGASAGAHADYQRGVRTIGGFLSRLNPQQAAAAGARLGQGANVARGVIQQEGQALAMRPRNVGRTVYSGLEAVPGDVLGAAKGVGRYALSQVGNRSILAGSPLGGRLESETVRGGARGLLGALQTYGHSVEYPTPLHEQLLKRNFGANRPEQIAHAGELAGQAISRVVRAGGALDEARAPLGGRLLPHDVRGAQTMGASFAVRGLSDIPNFYAGAPALLANLATHPGRTLAQAWQSDPILASIRTRSLHPLIQGLEQHPVLTGLEALGGLRAADRSAGAVGRIPYRGRQVPYGSVLRSGAERRTIGNFAYERRYSKAPVANLIQRRAETGQLPLQAVMPGRLGEAGRLRQEGVAPHTVAARAGFRRRVNQRIDFLQDRGVNMERTGRTASQRVHEELPRKLHRAFERTDIVPGIILRGLARPGHLVADLHTLREHFAGANKELMDRHAAAQKGEGKPEAGLNDKIRSNREAIRLLDRLVDENGRARPGMRKELATIEKHGFDALTSHADYVRGLDQRAVELGYLPKERLKAQYQSALEHWVGARRGEARDAYLTDAGRHANALLDHARDLEEHSGNMIAEHRAAQGAAAEAVKVAMDEAGRAKGAREPGLTGRRTVETPGGKVRVGRGAKDATLRTEEGPVAVKKLDKALRSLRTHLRNAAGAYGRGDRAAVTRHHELAKSAEKRAAEATRNLSPRVARRVQEAIAHEHAAEQAAREARDAAKEARQAHETHVKGMKDARIPAKRRPWMVIPDHGRESTASEIAGLQKVRNDAGEMLRQPLAPAAKAEYQRVKADAERKIAAAKERHQGESAMQPIETEEHARELLERAGVHLDSLAHVSDRFGVRDASAYHGGAQTVEGRFASTRQRTGQAARMGLADFSYSAVVHDLMRKRTTLETLKTHMDLIHDLGIGMSGGQELHRLDQARKVADDLSGQVRVDEHGLGTAEPVPGMPEYGVYNLADLYRRLDEVAARKEAMSREGRPIATAEDLAADFQHDIVGALSQDLRGGEASGSTGGRFVVLPKDAVTRLVQHANKSNPSDFIKGLQKVSQQFRKTVLLTSTRWLAGNVIEMLFRTVVMHGMGPHDVLAGRKVLRDIERVHGKEAREQFEAATFGQGAHFGTLKRFSIYRGPEAFREGSFGYHMAKILDGMRSGKFPPGWAVHKLWDLWARTMGGFNQRAEHLGDLAIVGRQAREDVRALTGRWESAMHLAGPAYDDLLNGLVGTARQERYAKAIDDIRGQYSRFSPEARRALQIMPFFPWYRNALKFMAITMPVHHPLKTAALAALYQGQAKELEKGGHTVEPYGLPPFLVGTADVKGGHRPLGHYLPFGAMDYTGFSQQVFPQASGLLDALAGQAFGGKDLTLSSGQHAGFLGVAAAALNGLAESIIPGVALLRRIEEGGLTSAPLSTVVNPQVKAGKGAVPAPGSILEHGLGALGALPAGAEKVFNPFHTIPEITRGGQKGGVGSDPVDRLLKKYNQGGGSTTRSTGGSDPVDKLLKKYNITPAPGPAAR